MNSFTQTIYKKLIYFQMINTRTVSRIKISASGLRGDMLKKFISPDKKKKFYDTISFQVTKQKGIFDKVSRPTRRVRVLNSVFIHNITDVISTGDIAPEIVETGIEIIGVKISNDFKTINVYWDVPNTMVDETQDLQAILNKRAPQLRAELISRNVIGKVPHLFFIRDETNARMAAFEKALASADMGPPELENFVPEADYLKNILEFKTVRKERKSKGKLTEVKDTTPEEKFPPKVPVNMRSNVFDLEHEVLMNKVLQFKKQDSLAKILPKQSSMNDDLFSKIPGVPLQEIDRNALLKNFCIERKKELKKMRKSTSNLDLGQEQGLQGETVYKMSDNYEEDKNFEPDYYDEDCLNERFIDKEN